MATDIIMPALGMAQETGKLVSWLKQEGEHIEKGEPMMEVETDKATMEIEAPASGVLSRISAQPGDLVPVGQAIGLILEPGEQKPVSSMPDPAEKLRASPLARRMATEHGLDLAQVKPDGGRVGKDDVDAYLAAHNEPTAPDSPPKRVERILASPKARRLAHEHGIVLEGVAGSGPEGAVLAGDVARVESSRERLPQEQESLGTLRRIMAERMTTSWTTAPHFYLVREVDASGLIEMRRRIGPAVEKRSGVKPTYTDLLVKLSAVVLHDHPEINASWAGNHIEQHPEINIGLAVGVEDGLVVPVIHQADRLSVGEISRRREDLVDRSTAHKLRPDDISGGTFTITNLGMYNVDAFLAVLNPPQAAILAVGRIADRVVPENGQVVIRPMVTLSLSCDHRVIDGLRAARFLDDFVNLVVEPWGVFA